MGWLAQRGRKPSHGCPWLPRTSKLYGAAAACGNPSPGSGVVPANRRALTSKSRSPTARAMAIRVSLA